jgi:hypothetical protein
LSDVEAMMQRMLAAAEERWAKHTPAVIHRSLDAESTTPDKVLDIPTRGDLDAMARSDLDLARGDPVTWESKAAQLAFLNEKIFIRIAETNDPNEQEIVFLSVNGKPVWLKRGRVEYVRRHYVEQLFRAKPQKVKVTVAKNTEGEVVNRTTKSSALAYPFEIVRDDNPKGKAWAQQLMREG